MKLEDARVVTSKFLQLKDELNNAIDRNPAARHDFNSPSNEEISYNVFKIKQSFEKLCDLLHEIALYES